MRIGLVGCVKTKLDRPAMARDLYISRMFTGRRAYVEKSCNRWFILSAKHGLVSPSDVIEPYDETLTGKPSDEKRRWSARVLRQLDALNVDYKRASFEVHAGADYRDFGLTAGLRDRGAAVVIPAEHLGQGEQLAFYARTDASASSPPRTATISSPERVTRGAYERLAEYLRAQEPSSLKLSFVQVERILGRSLPASARRHRAWWANEQSGTHTHARAWMDVRWRVESVDFDTGTVTFRRARR